MKSSGARTLATVMGIVLVLTTACNPQSAPSVPAGSSASGSGAATSSAPLAPKPLTIGIQREPGDLGVMFGQGTDTTAGGAGSVKVIVHDKLAVEMELDRWQAQLADALPSIEA